MVVEMPKRSVKGEQLGVQVSVFNFWNEPLEVLLTLKGSDHYK